ncbi:FmdB family zinc ribbon protein [Legionella waltersii]|uniref:Zinc ribbon domain protein n=1 Tax=Legionella waltersii TaxID=66969 RepID=A0A0W1A192_9GAMM|nr:zinc ribbon domain-containing protein [Legionella waltersii]KTD75119.1 Zinc ribbon domain protein [Legionella waltersii]SNV04985.1 Type I antifreeze protein [Legionella waltersii]
MPIYEYECSSCHHHFDLMQKISDAPVKQCPKCFENTVVKLISPAGFQLKGTGWYATDFKNKGSNVKSSSGDSSTEPTSSEQKSTESPASNSSESTKSTQGED